MAVILVAFIFVLAGLWSRTSLVVGKDVKLTLVLLVCEHMDRCVIYWEVFNTLFIGGVIFFIYFCHTSFFEASFSHHGDTGGARVTGQCTCGHCLFSQYLSHSHMMLPGNWRTRPGLWTRKCHVFEGKK